MPATDTVVIGAGQAGLAASRCLTDRGVDHVVLERGHVAERWRSERWDSLRLLTPNWMSRLPGWSYPGADRHGFMTATELTGHLVDYAGGNDLPVREECAVESLTVSSDRFRVDTTDGSWRARAVIMATGWCDRPSVPGPARCLGPSIAQLTPDRYRNPSSLPDGGVLVVGASATGVQLAEELAADGRDVVLAVGNHTRLPRTYRGMDVFWWLDRIGSLDRCVDELPDPEAARHEPSMQLVGRPDHRDLDLPALQAMGVTLTGRVVAAGTRSVRVADDLDRTTGTAELRRRRVLAAIDAHVVASSLSSEVLPPDASTTSVRTNDAVDTVDLPARGIRSVLWATGYRRAYPWLHVPVLDARGELRHHHGVTPVPGLYVLGARFQRTRSSNFLDGVGRDAEHVADHLAGHLAGHLAPCLSATS